MSLKSYFNCNDVLNANFGERWYYGSLKKRGVKVCTTSMNYRRKYKLIINQAKLTTIIDHNHAFQQLQNK